MYFLILSTVKWPEMSYFLEFKGWALVNHWLHAPKKHKSHSTLGNSMCLKLNKSKNSDRHFNCSTGPTGQYSAINAQEEGAV